MLIELALSAALGGAAAVRIDGDYPRSSRFRNSFLSSEEIQTTVRGQTTLRTVADAGAITIWRDKNDGRFLVSRAVGEYTETTSDGHRTNVHRVPLDSTSEFDELGYAKGGAADPAALIPIFPGHPVPGGGGWVVSSPVTSPYGHGEATYAYHIDRTSRAANGHILAQITLEMKGKLAPSKPSAAYSGSVSASGTIVWDCTAHQRYWSQTTVVYTVSDGSREIYDRQSESDAFRQI